MSAIAPVHPLPPEDLDHVLAHTCALWPEARGAHFFITGGTGFFGMWLLESFVHINDALSLGMHATILTRDPVVFAQKAPHLSQRADLTFIAGDIRDFIFPPGSFPYIIHAATAASAKLNDEAPREMFDTIIAGMRHMLDFAARKECGARKFLFTSSGAVYGRQPPDMTHIPETYAGAPDPLQAASAYGVGKYAAEHMCAVDAEGHGYEVKIARCFAFVGPHLPLDTHFAIGNFIRDAMRGGPVRIGGDGTPYRSYLYAADLAIWLWTILFRGQATRAYNVGSGEALSIAELARSVCSVINKNATVQIAAQPNPDAKPARYVPLVQRARVELGLNAFIPLAQAIEKTAAWHTYYL